MFKDVYKRANECITDDALKEKILHPAPAKKRSFVPTYSYATAMAAVLALVVFLTGRGEIDTSPQVAKEIEPVQQEYNYNGEIFIPGNNVRTINEPVSEARDTPADMMVRSVEIPAFGGKPEDMLYNFISEAESYAVSPFSLETALSISLNGADETTKTSILSVYGGEDVTSQNQKMSRLLKEYKKSEEPQIKIANSVWINKSNTDARFLPDFEKAVSKNYDAESQTVNNSNAVKTVNKWVAKNTENKIDGIISDSDFEGLIVNTVYFNGKFENEFNKKKTKKDWFTGNGVKYERDFMEQTSYLQYAKTDDAEIVKLPYVSDSAQISMYVLMGENKVINPVNLIETTTFQPVYINLKMPKFDYSYQTSLLDAVKNMGIDSLVFSNMTKDSLDGFDIIQKVYICTEEDGTEAAAATGIKLEKTANPQTPPVPYELIINKDFTFVIYDETNSVALFAGEVK